MASQPTRKEIRERSSTERIEQYINRRLSRLDPCTTWERVGSIVHALLEGLRTCKRLRIPGEGIISLFEPFGWGSTREPRLEAF